MAGKMPQSDMNELKAKVLIGRIAYLSEELGDPARYFPALRAKGVLYPDDCDKIKAKVTASEKVYEMIELIHTRQSEKDGHAMDVLVEALKKQRVQAHIARELQRALARARDQKKGEATPSPMAVSPHPDQAVMAPVPQSSLASATTPSMTSLGGSSMASPQQQYDMHPHFGPLPPDRPSKPLAPTSAEPSADIDPVFGMLPGLPPRRQAAFMSAQEGGTPGGGEMATGIPEHLHSNASSSLTDGTFPMQYQNGESHHEMASGQPGLDRRFSDISYTTTSYSTTSTEQSGLDYGRPHGEFGMPVKNHTHFHELEARNVELQSMCKAKDVELARLKRENVLLSNKYQELDDRFMDLQKQHDQLCEKMRGRTISDQSHLLESYRPGDHEDTAELRRQLQEKNQLVTTLQRQVEQFQQENQQLQLSLSSSGGSLRPHHLPIGSPVGGRPPPIHRPAFPPARSPHQAVTGPALGITPMRSMRVGDSLNQHNIHLQQSRSSTRDSPAYSPARDPGKVPAVFSPDREPGAKGTLFSPGSGKRLSTGSGDTPMGESYFQSSNSSLNSSGSKGSAGVTLQTATNAEHSTMV